MTKNDLQHQVRATHLPTHRRLGGQALRTTGSVTARLPFTCIGARARVPPLHLDIHRMHALALFAPRCRRDHAELCTREATERRMSEVLAEMRKQDRTSSRTSCAACARATSRAAPSATASSPRCAASRT